MSILKIQSCCHGKSCLITGLGVDGNLRVVPTQETTAPGVCVTLLQLTIADNGGMVLAPINLDLMCTINGEDLAGEINLISGKSKPDQW